MREGDVKKTKKQTESVLLNNIITNLGEEQQKTILLSTLIILETLFNQSHVTLSHTHTDIVTKMVPIFNPLHTHTLKQLDINSFVYLRETLAKIGKSFIFSTFSTLETT